jgi:protein TonB
MAVSRYFKNVNLNQPKVSFGLVVLAHVAILYGLIQVNQTLAMPKEMLPPMMVSLINSASPEQAVENEPKPAIESIAKPLPSSIKKPTKAAPETPILVAEANVKASLEPTEVQATVVDSEKNVQSNPASPANSLSETKHEAEPAKSAAKESTVEPPKFGAAYLNNPAPDYPSASRRFGEQGVVLLRVLVSMSGQAENVQIENSSGYNRLDQAAIKAVQLWSFVPAKRNNQPQSAYVLVPLKFSLAT